MLDGEGMTHVVLDGLKKESRTLYNYIKSCALTFLFYIALHLDGDRYLPPDQDVNTFTELGGSLVYFQ